MNEVQAREILFHFAIFCKQFVNMSHHEFKETCKDIDLAFSKNPGLVLMTKTYFDWRPIDVIEANNLQPDVAYHCGYWAFSGGKYGKK